MNIDQRLEKLVERHEALTQSVEMLATDLRELKTLVSDIAEGTARAARTSSKSTNGASATWKQEIKLSSDHYGPSGWSACNTPLSPNRHSRVVDHRGDVEASTA